MRVDIVEALYPLLSLEVNPNGNFEVTEDLYLRNNLAEIEYDVTQEEIAQIYEGSK